MFSYILQESFIQHPKVLTIKEIQKRLGINIKSASLLKKRIQLFCHQQLPKIKQLVYNDLKKEFKYFSLPKKGDVTELVQGKSIPQADTMALFSCGTRANKGRKRFRKSGLSASIYMSDNLGGQQKGSLLNTFTVPGKAVFYDSIPNLQSSIVGPILRKYLPQNTPLFTDMGYTWWTDQNHRMINHSRKSKDKRYKWARNRWSFEGVNTNAVESQHNVIKKAFASYSWIKPELVPLYTSEYSFFRSYHTYGLDKIAQVKLKDYRVETPKAAEGTSGDVDIMVGCDSHEKSWLTQQIEATYFRPLTLDERLRLEFDARKYSPHPDVLKLANQQEYEHLQKEIERFSDFYEGRMADWQRFKERENQYLAAKIWECLPDDGFAEINDICESETLSKFKALYIVRQWAVLGLVEVVDRTYRDGLNNQIVYDISKRVPILPDLIYQQSREELKSFREKWEAQIKTEYREKKSRLKYA